MDEATHRADKNGIIDPNKVLYVSVPSSADGNYFKLPNTLAPVILDCTYISATNIQKINVPENTEQVFFPQS